MRNTIREYMQLTDTEKKQLWKTAIFVFDANIFLDCYRYTKVTREEILGAIKSLKNRVWMPKQVAQEFMKNRPSLIYECLGKFDIISKKADEFVDECVKLADINSEDVDIKELRKYIDKKIEKLKDKCEFCDNPSDDSIVSEILELYEGKVGKGFTKERLGDLQKEFAERCEKLIPPGYKDVKKEKNAIGDFLLWREILEYAKSEKKNIIFVTEDKKEDWWWIERGKTIGPKYELKREFYAETQQVFYMYDLTGFLKHIKIEKGSNVNEAILSEIRRKRALEDQDFKDRMIMRSLSKKDLIRKEAFENIFELKRGTYELKKRKEELLDKRRYFIKSMNEVDDALRREHHKRKINEIELELQNLDSMIDSNESIINMILRSWGGSDVELYFDRFLDQEEGTENK